MPVSRRDRIQASETYLKIPPEHCNCPGKKVSFRFDGSALGVGVLLEVLTCLCFPSMVLFSKLPLIPGRGGKGKYASRDLEASAEEIRNFFLKSALSLGSLHFHICFN